MAEEAPAAAPAESPPQQKKKLPVKTIGIVLALLVVEGVVVVGAMTMLGGPSRVKGQDLAHSVDDTANELHEVLIVSDRFPNHSTGRVWLWDTEVQIKVKEKDLEYVKKTLEERNAEIKTGVSQIVRLAHHNHLKEPNLETLTRQFLEYLRTVFGADADGEQRVQAVLIPKCVGFPTDF